MCTHWQTGAKRLFSTCCVSELKGNPFRNVNQMWERGEGTGMFFFSWGKAHWRNLIFHQGVHYRGTVYFTLSEVSAVLNYFFSYMYTFSTFTFTTFVLLLNQLELAKEKWASQRVEMWREWFQNKEIKKHKMFMVASQAVPWYRGRAGGPISVLLENSFDVTKSEKNLKFLPNVVHSQQE